MTFSLSLLMAFFSAEPGAREPVLKQIRVPHPYYYWEMYLPQLTTGPSSLTWTSGGRSLVYSMAGSLWRQDLDSDTAVELTAGPGYDYQPDASPDGRSVAYVKYDRDAMELYLLDLASGTSRALTTGGQVNVEPRFSPDGGRIAFVSTSLNGRFHLFVLDAESLAVERLTGESQSPVPRYYYGPFDHELSPAWSPDGSEILFVSNRGRIHGTGGFFRMKASPGEPGREIHYEETNWKARPDLSPDGRRVAYASYLGRQWHQLWVMPAEGGDLFPLSYGDFDRTGPRWSPDGSRIASLSNEGGATAIVVQDVVGGRTFALPIRKRRYLRPMETLRVTVLEPAGRPTPARVSLRGSDGRSYAPHDAWMHADDAFVRSERPFEKHYFHLDGSAEITVPRGAVEIEVSKGLEHRVEKQVAEAGDEVEIASCR